MVPVPFKVVPSTVNTLLPAFLQVLEAAGELPNIYLSRDIKSVSELYGQRLYFTKTNVYITNKTKFRTDSKGFDNGV
jgi:hypothetical protein